MEHLKEIKDRDLFERYIEECFRYEFTITYNPKYVYSAEYALSMTDYVMKDVYDFCRRRSKRFRGDTYDSFYFNYCVEFQKNGYPHIHGTMFTGDHIPPQALANFESKMYRKYGRTDVYATGKVDKMHKNDHFDGTWQEYIRKESECKMYSYDDWFVDTTCNKIERFLVPDKVLEL